MKGNAIAHSPLWTTKEGERIRISDMETSHLFNAMKMLFNHLAAEHGGRPVWFNHRYDGMQAAAQLVPGQVAGTVMVMLRELDRRDDLPEHCIFALAEIRAQIEAPGLRGRKGLMP